MFGAFPKIWTLGHRYTIGMFNDSVEITEKIDGSQFSFSFFNGELICQSKRARLVLEAPNKLFKKAIEYVQSIGDKLMDNTIYYCEYLEKPKHNVLSYDRVPKNNLALFGVFINGEPMDYVRIALIADGLGIDVVPLIHEGKIDIASADDVKELLDHMLKKESFLGGPTIEGVVIKNYEKDYFIGSDDTSGLYIPLTSAKYVSEKFKEKHKKDWSVKKSKASKWETFINQYKTSARWEKAIQHLKEQNLLLDEPKDIGPLIKEIQRDIMEECKEEIMLELYKMFIDQIKREVIKGFPEWYKEKLLENFNVITN